MISLNDSESEWKPEHGNKIELSQAIVQLIISKSEMLNEYFGIKITKLGCLTTLPIIIKNYIPNQEYLPIFIFNLALKVDWKNEKQCFHDIANELSNFYSIRYQSLNNNFMETIYFPSMKEYLKPSKELSSKKSVFKLSELNNVLKFNSNWLLNYISSSIN
jgi:DNA mismatch repair protein MLH1